MKKIIRTIKQIKQAFKSEKTKFEQIKLWEKRRNFPPPGIVKQRNLREIAAGKINVFVETGCLVGDTLFALKDDFKNIYSIELDPFLFSVVKRRFSADLHIKIILGDSSKELPILLKEIREPALFWLDGHYSGEGTGRADLDTPILSEIESLLREPYNHILVIDDLRLFGTGDYPTQDYIEKIVLGKRPKSKIFTKDDALYILLQ